MAGFRWWTERNALHADNLRLTLALQASEDKRKDAEARCREAETHARVLLDHARVLLDVVDRVTRPQRVAPLPEGKAEERLPDIVERAIASRSGRGNVNRASQLRASARLLMKEANGDAASVAETLLNGSGDLDV